MARELFGLSEVTRVPAVRRCILLGFFLTAVWAANFLLGNLFVVIEGWMEKFAGRSLHLDEPSRVLGQPVRVFVSGESGVVCFRIPALVRTAQGTLLAFAEARYGRTLPKSQRGPKYNHGCSDSAVHEIAMKRSVDQGQTWSQVTFAAGSSEQHVGNPWPIATRSGRVLLVYVKHGPNCTGDCGDAMIGNGVVVSDDDGLTWSVERDVSEQFGAAKGCMPGPGAGVELGSGRLLVASHCGPYRRDYVTYSDDGGRAWATVPRPFLAMDEATVADLGGGHVLLNMRHRGERQHGRAVARSADGGLTWSDVTWDPNLIGPVCQGSLSAIGGSVYFANPTYITGRWKMVLKRSVDGGLTWSSALRIQSSTWTSGYSSIAQGVVDPASHTSGLLYESSEKGTPNIISFRTFVLDF